MVDPPYVNGAAAPQTQGTVSLLLIVFCAVITVVCAEVMILIDPSRFRIDRDHVTRAGYIEVKPGLCAEHRSQHQSPSSNDRTTHLRGSGSLRNAEFRQDGHRIFPL